MGKLLMGLGGGIFGIAYFAYGIVCMLALLAGIQIWLGVNAFFAFIIAIFLAYIPVVGTIAGFIGAVDGWGWSYTQATLLFFGPILVSFVFVILSTVVNKR